MLTVDDWMGTGKAAAGKGSLLEVSQKSSGKAARTTGAKAATSSSGTDA